jgi:acyl-coenzyme A thioesterase PaaI-like protein
LLLHLWFYFTDLDDGTASMRLTDNADHHNHVGGPHAGAMFTLAESASGAIIIGTFGDQLNRAVPFPTTAEISFLKVAMGDITAKATLGRSRDEVVAELDEGKRPVFPIEVELSTGDGTVTGRMTIIWTLKPNRK